MTDFTHATVGVGPNGGTEYRLWTARDTFVVVGKYKALSYLLAADREKAETMERDRKAEKRSAAVEARSWRDIMRGG